MAEPLQHLGPSSPIRTVPAPGGQPADIIELIMADHRRIRRLCRALADGARWGSETGSGSMLADVWEPLAGLLEAHIRAEEEICYLPVFWCRPHAAERRREAIADHEDIREALREASLQRIGSAPWWRAVRAVVATTVDHLDREERDVLAGFSPRLTMTRRRQLGRQCSAFTAAWRLDTVPGAGHEPRAGRGALPPARPGSYPDDRG